MSDVEITVRGSYTAYAPPQRATLRVAVGITPYARRAAAPGGAGGSGVEFTPEDIAVSAQVTPASRSAESSPTRPLSTR